MNLSTIITWASVHRDSLIGIFWGALGLSVTLEAVLTKFNIQAKKVGFTLLHLFAGLTGLATWLLGATGKDAVGTYAGLAVVASFWHRFAVSDINTKYVTPFLTWLSTQKAASPPVVAAPAATSSTSNPAPVADPIASQSLTPPEPPQK